MPKCEVFVDVNYPVFLKESQLKEENFKRIWQKVIYQAFVDAASRSKKQRDKILRQRAVEWLAGEEDSFHEVCLLAGFEPNFVKRQHRAILRNTQKWIDNSKQLFEILSGDID